MQSRSLNWLGHHGIWAIISPWCSTDMISIRVICFLGRFYFHFILVLDILQAFFNTTIIPLPFVGYQMNIANSCLISLISNVRSWNNCYWFQISHVTHQLKNVHFDSFRLQAKRHSGQHHDFNTEVISF